MEAGLLQREKKHQTECMMSLLLKKYIHTHVKVTEHAGMFYTFTLIKKSEKHIYDCSSVRLLLSLHLINLQLTCVKIFNGNQQLLIY